MTYAMTDMLVAALLGAGLALAFSIFIVDRVIRETKRAQNAAWDAMRGWQLEQQRVKALRDVISDLNVTNAKLMLQGAVDAKTKP